MAGEIITPTCEATGLPLPLLPAELRENGALLLRMNFHHHFHPNNHPILQGLAGRALRYSRGQIIDKPTHKSYHKKLSGPILPQSEKEIFHDIVFSCAGVVPQQAIDLSEPEGYRVINLSPEHFEKVSSPHSIYIEGAHHPKRSIRTRREIGKFFAHYAINQDLQDVLSEIVVEEFLDKQTYGQRRKELGNFILREALGVSIDGLVPTHRALISEGYVTPKRSQQGLFTVMRKFFTKDFFPAYYDEIEDRLGALYY